MSEFQDALDLSSSCFVFASAGSGKTKTLVDRYIKSLYFGIKPREILCLTFTNNAVLEMQERISTILENLLINKNDYVLEYAAGNLGINMDLEDIIKISQKLFFDFQNDISSLKILTIHSFCKDILKKFPLEANIAPNFEIIDEIEAKILVDEAKSNVLKDLCDSKSNGLLNELTESLSFKNFEDLVKKLCGDCSKFADFFSMNRDLNLYKEQLKKIFKLFPNREFSKEQREFIDLNFKNQNLEEIFLTKNGTIKKNFLHKDKEIIKEISNIVFENSINSKKELTIKRTYNFLEIARKIIEEYDALKFRQNALDFSDVLLETKKLLTSSYAKEFVLSKTCSTIKCVMIDEAQDLSYIQWELVSMFCEEIFSPMKKEKTLFVVGDVKQSIYRFQNANHKLLFEFYNYAKTTLNAIGKKIQTVYLNKCYRSLPKILDVVDKIFLKNSYFAFGQSDKEYKKHVPYRTSNEGDVQIIKTTDATEIVEFIKKLIESKKIVPSTKSEIQSKDILILSRSRNELYENIISKCAKYGIKIAPPDRIKLSENLLIMDMLALADVCINPQNSDYSLVCVLKSPFVFKNPFSDEKLLEVCRNRIGSVFDNITLSDYAKLISNCISAYKENNLVEFFYYIMEKIIIKANKNDDYVLSFFINEAIKFSNKISNNIKEFVNYFRKNEIEISNQNASAPAIRISTIHGAKGLESPIVILLDFDLKTNKQKTIYIWENNKKIFGNNKKDSPIFFIKPNAKDSFNEADYLAESEYKEEEKELFRLLYVALTRAQDRLFVIGANDVVNLIEIASQ